MKQSFFSILSSVYFLINISNRNKRQVVYFHNSNTGLFENSCIVGEMVPVVNFDIKKMYDQVIGLEQTCPYYFAPTSQHETSVRRIKEKSLKTIWDKMHIINRYWTS